MMPSLDLARRLSGGCHTNGGAKKRESDQIMEQTWWDDIESRVAYLYDWYRDDYKTQLNNLNPRIDEKKIPIDIKYIVSSSQTYSKDPVTHHLQLRPSQEINVPYYNEFFTDRYKTMWPCGLYADISDAKGRYNRWLIVAEAEGNHPQFVTHEILRCNHVIQYVIDGRMYNVPAVLRSQNSY